MSKSEVHGSSNFNIYIMIDIITLTNGKKVANFSSPHSFKFTDGSILPAVSDELAEELKVTFIEECDEYGDTKLTFELSDRVLRSMVRWVDRYDKGEVDVVFVALPMLQAMRDNNYKDIYNYPRSHPFRAVRIEDRIKKLVSIEKQTIL
jgi:hypothetical protein